MFLNKKATSMVEAMVVLLIVVSGVIGMYQVLGASQKLSNSTKNKIQAIQMAREAIEGMKNIRDTNWILYGSDNENCWNVYNYNNSCVLDNTLTTDISEGSYIIYQDTNNKWKIKSKVTETSFNQNYRDKFKIKTDSNGFYTQSGGTDIIPLFTREIKISYLDNTNNSGDSNDPKMEVISLVQWVDSSSDKAHKVEFKSILTNWKK